MEHPEQKITALIDALAGVIRGNRESIEILVISLLSNGSVLLQDVPGVGKTTLAKAVAKAIDVQFHRVQFTPDLLPAGTRRILKTFWKSSPASKPAATIRSRPSRRPWRTS